ncbi:MAG TPA: molecular chaperone DnaJ [Polyangiaceae bacterium]|nr:molecular chaperone DnaJ [Polyangiaceae bacterium]
MKDPYQVLGVDRHSTADQIRSAFKKLAAKHHPDKNPDDPDATQRFKEINAAYQILSDPKKRAMFDRFGPAGVGSRTGAGPFGGMPIDFGDLHIDGLFGELLEVLGIRFGDRGDVQTEISIDFEEAAFGCTKQVSYNRTTSCKTCGGNGAARGSKLASCGACGGRGRVRYQQGVFPIAVERACSRCHGSGRVVQTPCDDCKGAGLTSKQETIEVAIPAGIESGNSRRVEGRGNAVRGKKVGDLEVIVRVKPHDLFRRDGDNIICTLPVTFAQAALGDEVEVPTLDGRGLMRIPSGTQPGTVLRIRGKGLPRRVVGGRGDQLVSIHVEVPTELNTRQRELILELAGELGETVQPQRRTFMDKLRALFE